jgi:hypothetical protein
MIYELKLVVARLTSLSTVRDMCAAKFFGAIVTTTGHLYHSNNNRNSHKRKVIDEVDDTIRIHRTANDHN